jgi:hypothetical protein
MSLWNLAEMLPGTPIRSLDELKNLPAHTVVLRRSGAQPSFRTAWTLTVLDAENRYWSSSSWRAQHSDEDLFKDAIEAMVLLYRPLEQFGIGLLNEAGHVADQSNVALYGTLGDAQNAIGQLAAQHPMYAILRRIAGSWIVYEGD